MINPIHQIAKLITEHPDIINHNILLESLENKIKKLLTKLSNQLPHEINIDEITQFATQQKFKELGVSRWIAKQVAFNPNLRVDWSLLTDYIAHLKFRDNNEYKALFKSKIQEIIKDAEEWHSSANNEAMINNESIIAEFPNGYRIVQLITREHCEAEGELMDNCVKNYDPKETDLYSLRSPDGKPHVTIQVLDDGRINELKGRQNKPPVKKYADLVIPWVNSILNDPKKLFDDPDVNFTDTGFNDYVGSLSDEGLLRKLASSNDKYIRRAVANNPNAPVNILRLLSQDEDKYVRWILIKNSNITPDILRLLSKDEDENVRIAVSNSPNVTPDILRLLSKDEDWKVRAALAYNLNTPLGILRLLSQDEDEKVRREILNNPNVPLDILRSLSQDEDKHIRRAVAYRSNVTPDILRLLSKDEDENVREAVAYSPNIPFDILELLSKDKHWSVRSGVAENPNTPIDLLRVLSKDEHWYIRNAVAGNLNTPIDILRVLSKDEDGCVRQDAIKTLEKLEN